MPSYEADDGTELHHDVIGSGSAPAVIVLAGGAARHPVYLGDLGGLDGSWRLCIPHLRGVGRSAAPADQERGSFWRQAADIDRLREHLGLDRCLAWLRLVPSSASRRQTISVTGWAR